MKWKFLRKYQIIPKIWLHLFTEYLLHPGTKGTKVPVRILPLKNCRGWYENLGYVLEARHNIMTNQAQVHLLYLGFGSRVATPVKAGFPETRSEPSKTTTGNWRDGSAVRDLLVPQRSRFSFKHQHGGSQHNSSPRDLITPSLGTHVMHVQTYSPNTHINKI